MRDEIRDFFAEISGAHENRMFLGLDGYLICYWQVKDEPNRIAIYVEGSEADVLKSKLLALEEAVYAEVQQD